MVLRRYYINDVLVEPPVNAEGTNIQLNFDKEAVTNNTSLSVNDFEWARENTDLMLKHFNDGKVLEGLPIRYELEQFNEVQKIFNGYLDFTNGVILSKEISTIKAVERGKTDWLNETADSVSFEYLEVMGKIKQSDYEFMPYVLNSIPNYRESFICLLSIAVISNQLYDQITTMAEFVPAISNPMELSAIIRAAIRVLFIVSLIATLVKLILDLYTLIIQPVKYHAVMPVKRLMEIGCANFGYTFKSTIFEQSEFKDMYVMPIKNAQPNTSDFRILGFTSPSIDQRGYETNTTFGQFLRGMKTMFKAKITITDDKELYFEREDFGLEQPNYILPNVENNEFSINVDELKSNYVISFQTDLTDKNTIQQYKGNLLQVITSLNGSVPVDLNLLKGLEQVNIPYARLKRKEKLTVPEEILKIFYDVFGVIINALITIVNVVISVVNSIIDFINDVLDVLDFIGIEIEFRFQRINPIPKTNLAADVQNRIGMAELEMDFTGVPKLFILSKGSEAKYNKVSMSNSQIINARNVWDKYHAPMVSFLPSVEKPNGNQFIIKEYKKVPFSYPDYKKVKLNNSIFTIDGKSAKIDNARWNDYNEQADMKVRISQLYIPSDRINETYIEPDGQ